MQTPARLLTTTALAAASIALAPVNASAASTGAPTRPGDRGDLELSPRTARPGDTVTVRTAACGRNGRGRGFAESVGDGEFRLAPRKRQETAKHLDTGKPPKADKPAETRRHPETGKHKESAEGRFRVPRYARSGSFRIRVRCDNGRRAEGTLRVEHAGPTGHVRTGAGGSVAPDTARIAAGTAVLAATAAGGTWLLRRRASGAQDS
ncbi:hypothetical protein [Streptomyces sp. NRRL F-5135]|uniref:hypothetical protein n=1 Tax=Streptomyces sp. NRRL F-5135 TaxID=1463858 RepID=UPI0004C68DBA|nr:hypothetical protein [Streptomyces sp. NRRL F-5135]